MKKIIIILAVLCLLPLSVSASCLDGIYPPLGLDAQYLGLDGMNAFRIKDVKGDVLILVVSSYYCGPCHREADKLREVHDLIDAKGLSGKIKIMSVAAGDNSDMALKFADRHSLRYPVVPDPNLLIARSCGATRIPFMQVYKLGPDPKQIYSHVGLFQESPAQFLAKVEQISGVK